MRKKTEKTAFVRFGRILCLLLCVVFAAFSVPSFSALAEEQSARVRVGWHEEPYFITDPSGRLSGYTYDYQHKLSAYTGWEYEYVKAGWSELLQMLKDGRIDMLGNVSYSEERAKDMLFASLPMGTEVYCLFVPTGNTDIITEDYSSLDGKRVGVAKGSIQRDIFLNWAETYGVDAELVELTTTEDESLLLLGKEIDAFVTMDLARDYETARPVWKIGSSDFFFAVSKSRPDLLVELNAAMNRIQDENKYFNQQLNEKYLGGAETNRFLTDDELDWLSAHGPVRVGYQDNYLAFCAKDESGALTGALKDYLDYASTALENADIVFEAVAFATASEALEALERGEVDCMFPANLSEYESESLGVVMTPAFMRTEMDAVVRSSEVKEFIKQEHVAVAVNRGNTNYDMFVAKNYPGWEIRYFDDTPACLEAVAGGEADCVIISNYRYNNIAKQCEKLRLTTVYTGVDMDFCLAVRRGETVLYSILAKLIAVVPDSTVHTALTSYSSEDVKTSFADLLKENLAVIIIAAAAVLIVILFFVLRSVRAEKKADEEARIVKDLNKKVFVDALTSVRNKGAFVDYIEELEERLELGEEFDLAIGVFDCDDLKVVNDEHGHDKGDEYLKAASRLICRVFQHSPVFRIGGDEFAVILMGEDFSNREALVAQFEKSKSEISSSADNPWEQVRIALGVAVYDPAVDGSVNDTAGRADKIMYENKNAGKKHGA